MIIITNNFIIFIVSQAEVYDSKLVSSMGIINIFLLNEYLTYFSLKLFTVL